MDRWRRYVRAHLPPLDVSGERELEIVEELAQQLEAAYQSAIDRGAAEQEATRAAGAEIGDWHAFAETVSRIERPIASRLPARMRPGAEGRRWAGKREG